MPAKDPAVQRFMDKHSVSDKEAAEQEAELGRGMTPEERILASDGLIRSCARAGAFDQPPSVLDYREPPHPSYYELLARYKEWRDQR